MKQRSDLLQGTLDLLILKTLELEPRHGLGISRRLEQVTQGTFKVEPGSLFPALHRLEDRGYVEGYWSRSENNRRAKYYRLTHSGKKQLLAEAQHWRTIAIAIARVLETNLG